MDSSFFVALLVVAAICGLIGIPIAKLRGRDEGEGFALGFFLGPIGWIIEAVQTDLKQSDPRQTATDGRPLQKCPYCAEMILVEAKICKHCGRDVPPENAAKILAEKARKEAEDQAVIAAQTAEDNSFTKVLVLVVLVCILVVIGFVIFSSQPAKIATQAIIDAQTSTPAAEIEPLRSSTKTPSRISTKQASTKPAPRAPEIASPDLMVWLGAVHYHRKGCPEIRPEWFPVKIARALHVEPCPDCKPPIVRTGKTLDAEQIAEAEGPLTNAKVYVNVDSLTIFHWSPDCTLLGDKVWTTFARATKFGMPPCSVCIDSKPKS